MNIARTRFDDMRRAPLDVTASALRLMATAARLQAAMMEASAQMIDDAMPRNPVGTSAADQNESVVDLDEMRTRGA